MPQYTYLARDAAGRNQSGTLAADSVRQIADQLRGRGWIVVDIRAAASRSRQWLARLQLVHLLRPRRWLPATQLDVQLGLGQLATMLRSGLTLLAALRTAAEQSRRPAMAEIWRRLADRIETGASLAGAMAEERRARRLIPPMVSQLVRIGEETGTLDAVLKRACDHIEQRGRVRTALLTSLMYPAFVLLAAVGVTAFMVFGLIPKLQSFLAGSGRRLPAVSAALLDITTWLNANRQSLLLGVLAALVAIWIAGRVPAIRAVADRAAIRTPIIGRLFRLAGTATVARALAILIDSGISLLSGLATVRDLVANRAMQDRLDAARASVVAGGSLADGLAGREFMPMLSRMTAVGETTGTLAPVLAEVADFHESQLAAAVRRFSALIEPITIAVVGGIVGFVYIAFFMALFSVVGGGGAGR